MFVVEELYYSELRKVVDKVRSRSVAHQTTWVDQPDSYWTARLMQEVGELASALVGDHADSPDWELEQIASICINWLIHMSLRT